MPSVLETPLRLTCVDGLDVPSEVVSRTVIGREVEAVRPALSVAMKVTTVVPTGNTDPLGTVLVTAGCGSTPSKASGIGNETKAPWGPDASTVRAAGVSTRTGPP